MKRNLIIFLILAVLIAAVITLWGVYKKESKERKRVENNLKNKTREWVTKEGNFVKKTTVYESTIEELKKANLKKDQYSNKYYKDLLIVRNELDNLKIKYNNVVSAQVTQLESQGSTLVHYFIRCDSSKLSKYLLKLDSIKFPNLSIYFYPDTNKGSDTLKASYLYRLQIFSVIDRNKYRKNGKEVIFLPKWKFWKPWVYENITTSNDPNAKIKNNVNFEFIKKGRK